MVAAIIQEWLRKVWQQCSPQWVELFGDHLPFVGITDAIFDTCNSKQQYSHE